MNEPNIFHFATSELSQDAFIAWLIAWWQHPEHPGPRQAAEDLVASLYELYSGVKLPAGAVSAVHEPRLQHKSIDVCFEAVIQGRPVAFIIEDKTYTTPHSNQLERYHRLISSEKPESEVVCIYYKTGYLLPEDERALATSEEAGARYAVVGSEWMGNFLDRHPVGHPIYTAYRQYLEETFIKPVREIGQRLFTNNEFSQFKEQDYQVEFLKALARKCPAGINQEPYITCDMNTGGTPRSQYWFAVYNKLFGDFHEHLFYRIDKRRNPATCESGFYLRLSQYGWVDKNPEGQRKKRERLEKYRLLFTEAVAQHSGLDRSPTGDRGLHESEVGILFFDDNNNTVRNVLESMPRVHEAFVRAVEKALRGTPT